MTRSVLALVLEAVFFALAFGWRSWVQWRRTGSTGFIRPRRGAPLMELVAAGLVTASFFLLPAGPAADLAGVERFAGLDNGAAAVAGAVLAVAGIVLTLAAQFAMGESWRIGVDTEARTDLVTDGIFGHVRNPIFSAMVVAAVGLVLLVPNVVSVVALVVLVVGLELQVRRVEEPYLRGVHDGAYVRYVRTAGRFVPGVGLDRASS